MTWRLPLVFVCSLVYLASGIRVGPRGDSPPFDIDEAHKLSESYYYHLFFEQGAWRHADWQADFYARTNPPVAKYVFGAALAAAGLHVHDRRLQDDFAALWRTPDALRRKVPDAMLRVTRGVSVTYGALVCALLFWIGQRMAGLLAGILAASLLLANPSFLQTARGGLTDTILLFHLTLIVPASLCAARTLRERSARGRLLAMTVLVPGLVTALATGSKMNGALAGPVYAGSLLLAAVVEPGAWRRGRLIARSLLAGGLAAVVAVAVLVVLDPTLQGRPLGRLHEAFVVFGDWMVKQQIEPGPALLDLRERAAYLGVLTLRVRELTPLSRPLAWAGSGLMVIGFCLGLVTLATRSLRSDTVVVLCWIVGVVAGVTLWMPVAHYRYTLPPALPIILAAAIGLAALPRAGGLILAVARRASAGPGPLTALTGAAAVAALGLGVTWVADPVHLDPRAHGDLPRPDVERSYLDAAQSRPRSPDSQQRVGILYLMRGRSEEAADRFAAALGLVPHDPPADGPSAVRRSILLFDLARARAGAGDLAGARDALREHVAAVQRVRAGLRSGDPFVLAAFDRLITERAAMAADLRSPRVDAGRRLTAARDSRPERAPQLSRLSRSGSAPARASRGSVGGTPRRGRRSMPA